MSAPSQISVTPWVLWALLSVVGAHRLYLGVGGWWYYPAAFVAAVALGLVGLGAIGGLLMLGYWVLWFYDAAHIAGWSAREGDRK